MPRTLHTMAKPRSNASRLGEQGVTLLELLIAMSLGIIVVIAVSKTMMGAGRSAISVKMDTVADSLLSQVSQIIRDPVLCSRAFVDLAGNPIDVNPTTWVAGTPISVPRFDLNGAKIARTGGYVSGLRITKMELDNPAQIAGPRYRWTFRIQTDKVELVPDPVSGLTVDRAFGGNPTQIHNYRMTITTKDGSPDYHVISCGIAAKDPLTVPPPPIAVGRSYLTIAQALPTTRLKECTDLSSDYTPATLLDLIQVGAAPGGTIVQPPGSQPMLVADDTANAYILTHPAGPTTGMEILNTGPGTGGQVACVHKTAPIRFTMPALSSPVANRPNFEPAAGPALHNLECNRAFGPNYVEALFSDLLAYGFTTVPANSLNAVGGVEVTLGGTANGCLIGFHNVGANPAGPAIDCSKPGTDQNQIGCVIRTN